MNEKEIRIGNIVSCFYRNENTVEVIKSIWYNDEEKLYKVKFESGHFSGTNGISINGIMPIKLTEEILEKIGFKSTDDYLHFGDFTLNCYKDGFMICVNENDRHITKPISFIHELQNVYSELINKELEIR